MTFHPKTLVGGVVVGTMPSLPPDREFASDVRLGRRSNVARSSGSADWRNESDVPVLPKLDRWSF